MKIIATIDSFGAAANIGGSVESTSYTIEVPDRDIPHPVYHHVKDQKVRKWQTLSLSILRDE